jgi:UDP-2,3-diacylglucosamine pyrophosphatase LpxH
MKKITKPIVFVGDLHGDWYNLLNFVILKRLSDLTLFSVGDIGMGFDKTDELETIEDVAYDLNTRNIDFIGIRGNHDDPKFFRGSDRLVLKNFELLEDYTILEYENKKIQAVGGAVSIDRTGRVLGRSHWEDEGVVYRPEQLEKVDVLVTHTAPSFCFPNTFNEMVYGWAREDAYLLEDLTDERAVLDEIFKVCAPSLHVYGHFHAAHTETINGCTHRLLNICEFWRLPSAADYEVR